MTTDADARSPRTVLIAPDKFRGSLTGPDVVAAAAAGAEQAGWAVIGQPMADGGEGMLDAFGGANRTSTVTGPAGTPVQAQWRLGEDGVAVVESAAASGLLIAGGKEVNDPMTATSTGTGELIAEAVLAGAQRVIVGLGGSAMSDGGTGAVTAVLAALDGQRPAERGTDILVACDVQTPFTEAAAVFGPQKGATAAQIVELTGRLFEIQGEYVERFGIDVSRFPGAGAAGGLGGALVALGGELVPGLALVAAQVGLDDAIARADAVVTGEGALDAESFNGKVVGGVVDAVEPYGIPVVVVAGTVRPDAPVARLNRLRVVDLTETYGANASWEDTARCVTSAVRAQLESL